MTKNWWKYLSILLISYSIISGFLIKVPALPVLHETIRNIFFHVTMWFTMFFLLGISFYNSINFLLKNDIKYDCNAIESVKVALLFGILGLFTGMTWANFTWGSPWVNDPKLNGTAVALLMYLAYTILRASLDDKMKKAKISAVYNIFCFVMLFVLIGILPRIKDSLHPGNGGNPAFNQYDLDKKMRLVFYPAVIGWILFGYWIFTIKLRLSKILNNDKIDN